MNNFFENSRVDIWADWFKQLSLHQAPLAPVFLLLLEEAGIPLPIPGDVYLAFMGYQVSQGKIPYLVAFLMILFSVLVGSSILYFISKRWGNQIILRVGKYIHLNEHKVLIVEKYFKRYGILVIIFGRHIPGFRVPVTFFAGISGVPYTTFILSTFISVVFWIALYLSIGEKLGKKVLHLFHTNPYAYLLFSIPFLIFIVSMLYVRFKNRNKKIEKK